jgi:two-component system, NarL family, nitrate/nitrite response regulator NarL
VPAQRSGTLRGTWGEGMLSRASENAAGSTRVVLVEDHSLLAEALLISLTQKGFDVQTASLPSSDDPAELFTTVFGLAPDVALVDLDLGAAGDGSRLIGPLSRSGVPVVVLTARADPVRCGECLERGAVTVLDKSAPLEVLTTVLTRAHSGEPVLPDPEREELIRAWHDGRPPDDVVARLDRLTPREAHVLQSLLHGLRVREIAERAGVSEGTVRTQVKSVFTKLGVTSQLAAVAMAHEAGWTSPRWTANPTHPTDAR